MAGLSMYSMATGTIPAPMIAATHARHRPTGLKTNHHRPRAFRRPLDTNRRLGHDAELAFRTDHQSEQIETRRIEIGPADFDDFTINHHHLNAKHIVERNAVLEAVRPARIHGDVTGNRAGQLA